MGSRLTRRSMAVREFVRSNWHVVTIAVTTGAIVCAAVFLLSTMPPRSITMATRPVGGGYNEIGRQYQALLAKAGVELRLVVTAGMSAIVSSSVQLPDRFTATYWTFVAAVALHVEDIGAQQAAAEAPWFSSKAPTMAPFGMMAPHWH